METEVLVRAALREAGYGPDAIGSALPRIMRILEAEDIRLEVGTAFDLSAERERMRFDLDRAGRTMTESFQVTLANAGDEDATIIVTEPMPRWSDWEVTTSSVPATRRDAQHAEFEVPVPADGETVLTYTVRYRWPAGMRL